MTTDGKAAARHGAKTARACFSRLLSGQQQIYRYDLDKGTAEKLTDFELGVSDAVVSPDGNLIAFTANVYPAPGCRRQSQCSRHQKRSEGPMQAHIADKLLYRHWTEYSDGLCQHIIVFDISKKTYTDVTPAISCRPSSWLAAG